jgi:hypothetical protein
VTLILRKTSGRREHAALAFRCSWGTLLHWSNFLHGSQRRPFGRLHTGGRFTLERSHGTSPSHRKYFIVVVTQTAQSSTNQLQLSAQDACPVLFESNSAFGQIHDRTLLLLLSRVRSGAPIINLTDRVACRHPRLGRWRQGSTVCHSSLNS